MNAEYQRLEAEASEVQQQISELVSSCNQMAAAEFQKFEARIIDLHQRLAGLRQGMGLLRLAGSAADRSSRRHPNRFPTVAWRYRFPVRACKVFNAPL